MEILYSIFIGKISSKIASKIAGIVLQCRRGSISTAPAFPQRPRKREARRTASRWTNHWRTRGFVHIEEYKLDKPSAPLIPPIAKATASSKNGHTRANIAGLTYLRGRPKFRFSWRGCLLRPKQLRLRLGANTFASSSRWVMRSRAGRVIRPGWTVPVSSVSSEMVQALHVSELVEHDNVTLA